MNWISLVVEANDLRTRRMEAATQHRLLSQSRHRKTISRPGPMAVYRVYQAAQAVLLREVLRVGTPSRRTLDATGMRTN